MNNDKLTEKIRYDTRSENIKSFDFFGIDKIPEFLKVAYLKYYELIDQNLFDGKICLEIGSGTGEHIKPILNTGATVVVSDISYKSLSLIYNRELNNITNLIISAADMEKLPFKDASFDVVTCAGSMAYGDWIKVKNEISRVLRPGGALIFIDVFNHNPIYKINRLMHYLKKNRSWSVVTRAPNQNMINLYAENYKVKVYYYGSCIYLAPLISFFVCKKKTNLFLLYLDNLISVKKSAFRIVVEARKQ